MHIPSVLPAAGRITRLRLVFIASASLPVLVAGLNSATAASVELKGNYVWTGVSDAGTLGMGDYAPPGIRHDPSGAGNFPDSTRDYLTPGTPLESFVISTTETGLKSNSNSGHAHPNITGSVVDYSGIDFGGSTYDQRAVWTGSFSSFFEVVNDTYFNNDDERISITTTIKALTDLTDVSFLRYIDPDPDNYYPGGSAATFNERGYGSIAPEDFVTSSGSINGLVLSLFTNSTVAHNTGITGWSSRPADYLSGTDIGDGDNTIGPAFDIGRLLSGESISFSYYYLFGSDLGDLESTIRDEIVTPPPPPPACGDRTASTIGGSPCIDGGTLTLDGATDTVDTDIDLGTSGGAVDTAGHDTTLSGDISGTTLTKAGTGTLVLTGENTHTGTIVTGGTLAVNGDAALGATGADVALTNATFAAASSFVTNRDFASQNGTIDTGSNLLAIGGTVSGSTLTKAGSGTLVLTGANTHTGTVVTGGTLAVNGDAALGAAGADVALTNATFAAANSFATNRDFASQNGTIDTGANTLAIGGTVSGSTLTKAGTGTLVLTGSNSHTGTVITGGTLAVNGDAALGAAGADVALANATFAAAGSFATNRDFASQNGTIDTGSNVLAIGGTVSGTTLTKAGAGTLVLTGENTHTGTIVTGGTLAVNGDAALGAAGADVALTNATFAAANSFVTNRDFTSVNGAIDTAGHDLTFGGTVTGVQCLIKRGQGTMQMTGTANLAQGACVEEGLFSVNGTVNGQVFVFANGNLSGAGVIRGNTQVDGTLRPGNSPGTLVINGDVTMSDTGALEVEIDGVGTGNGAGNFDRVIVAGADSVFTANGTLRPMLRGIEGSATNSFTPTLGQGFRFVEAEGGVAGRFDTLAQPTDGLAAGTRLDVTYGGNDITLWVTPVAYADLTGLNPNQSAAGGAVDALRAKAGTDAAAAAVLAGFYPLEQAGIVSALSQAAGTIHADALAANLHGRREFGHALAARQAAARWDMEPGAWDLWGRALTSFGTTNERGAAGFDREQNGALTGADRQWTEAFRAGFALGYLDTSVNGYGLSGSAGIESFQALVYGSYKMADYRIDGTLGYGYSRYDTSRSIGLAGLSRSSEGETHSHDLAADVAVSRTLNAGPVAVTPRLGLRYDQVRRASFTEKDAGLLNLGVGKQTLDALEASLDLTVRGTVKAGALTLHPQVEVGYARDLLDERVLSRNSLSGSTFAVTTADDDRDTLRGGVGFTAPLTTNASFSAGYNTEWRNDNVSMHQFNVGLTVRW